MSRAATYLGGLNSLWNNIAAFAGGIVALVASFTFAPPFQLAQGNLNVLAKVIVGVIVAALLLPFKTLRCRKDWYRWTVAALATLLVSVTILFVNWELQSLWIRHYAHRGTQSPIVIGTHMFAPKAAFRQEWLATNGQWLTEDDMLERTAGKAEWLWPESEIRLHTLILVAAYLCTVVAFSITIALAVQAASCAASDSEGQ